MLNDEINNGEIKLKVYNFIQSGSHSKHTGGACIYVRKGFEINKPKQFAHETVWISSCEIKCDFQITFETIDRDFFGFVLAGMFAILMN